MLGGECSARCTGCPITIKDAIETEGIRSTGGAVELTDHVPDRGRARGRPAQGRRRRSCSARPTCRGGRATCRPTTSSSAPRTTRGTLDRITGGLVGRRRPPRSPPGSRASSSAPTSAARCASRRTAAASFGLKPSFGVVPQRGYLDHVGGGTTDADINVFGPIARSADDLDLLLSVLAGPEPERAGRVAARAAAAERARRSPTSTSACGSTRPASSDRLGVRAMLRARRRPPRRRRACGCDDSHPDGRLRGAERGCS